MRSADVSARSASPPLRAESSPVQVKGRRPAKDARLPFFALLHKSHRGLERPPFECIALVLQGGGALGAFQAGVYEALAEANLHPDWVAGISIGAINAALIAGNPPEQRVARLREFWQAVSESPLGIPPLFKLQDDHLHRLVNQARALNI